MIEAWVDGSYREKGKTKIAGWAFVVVDNDEPEFEDFGNDIPAEYMEHRNVAGEIFAVMNLLQFCMENEETEVTIHYDYEGLEKWAVGEWKTNKELTKQYKNFVRGCGMDITWKKVAGHSGEKWNEYADSLAKNALDEVLPEENEENYSEPLNKINADSSEIVREEKKEETVSDHNVIFAETEKLQRENKLIESLIYLKPYITEDCSEKLFGKYMEIKSSLGEFYAKEAVTECEEFLKTHPKSPVMKQYCYALFNAYCVPAFARRDFSSYMEAKKAIRKILDITKHPKAVNEFLFPFAELSFGMGDVNFLKNLPSLVDINLFSKEKGNIGGKIFPSHYDRIIDMIK
ncbi:MAG: hypothetical protein KBT47_01090 [Armatimonadetes bacterium]|nr:hypothetical protein [Candidatus Hippobium faecium]